MLVTLTKTASRQATAARKTKSDMHTPLERPDAVQSGTTHRLSEPPGTRDEPWKCAR